jgi:hypothetical protein
MAAANAASSAVAQAWTVAALQKPVAAISNISGAALGVMVSFLPTFFGSVLRML